MAIAMIKCGDRPILFNRIITFGGEPQVNANETVRYLTLMIVGCVVMGAAAYTQANDEDAHALCAHYRKTCEHILSQVHSGHIDAASVQKDAEDLIGVATKICKLYEAHHPEATELMEFVIHETDHMKHMSLADLKTKWHDGDVYKTHDVGFDTHDPKNAHYMWPADALIHPATVWVIAHDWAHNNDKEHLHQIEEELEDVLHHLGNIEKELLD